MSRPGYEDTRRGPKPVHAREVNAMAVGWRRQHATQAWQAMQCWLLVLCVQRVTVQRGLELLAEQRDRHMSPELRGAVERLSRRRA